MGLYAASRQQALGLKGLRLHMFNLVHHIFAWCLQLSTAVCSKQGQEVLLRSNLDSSQQSVPTAVYSCLQQTKTGGTNLGNSQQSRCSQHWTGKKHCRLKFIKQYGCRLLSDASLCHTARLGKVLAAGILLQSVVVVTTVVWEPPNT